MIPFVRPDFWLFTDVHSVNRVATDSSRCKSVMKWVKRQIARNKRLLAVGLMALLPQMALVTNVAHAETAYLPGEKALHLFDTASNTVVATIPFGDFSGGVADITVNPSGTRVYMAHLSNDIISVFDTSSNSFIQVIPSEFTVALAMNPQGTYLYASTGTSRGYTISVIDTATNSIIKLGEPLSEYIISELALNSEGNRLYSSLAQDPSAKDSSILVIDTTTNTKVQTLGKTYYSWGIALNSDGTRLYVSDYLIFSTVRVVDTTTGAEITSIPIKHEYAMPSGIKMNPRGDKVYVASDFSNNVSVIDTTTNTVSKTIPTTVPVFGMSFNSNADRLYLTSYYNDDNAVISVVDTTTDQILNTVPVSGGSRGEFIAPVSILTVTTPVGGKISNNEATINCGMGNTDCIEGYSDTVGATTVQLVATPDTGYQFVKWSEECTDGTVIIDKKAKNCAATFSRIPYTAYGQLLGKTGKPLAGATIHLGEYTAITDKNGNWSISDLIAGDYLVVASKGNNADKCGIARILDNGQYQQQVDNCTVTYGDSKASYVAIWQSVAGELEYVDTVTVQAFDAKFQEGLDYKVVENNGEYLLEGIDDAGNTTSKIQVVRISK